MKRIIFALGLVVLVAGCTATERGAVIGGATGAAVGAAVADDTATGAIVGGAVGATAGALIGRASEPGQCIYRDEYGERYVAPCP